MDKMTLIIGLNGIQEKHEFITFADLLDEWEPTEVQRVINGDRVLEIAESIRRKDNIQGTFSFTVAEIMGKRHLVDGQHRLMALKQLMMENDDIKDLIIHVRTIPLTNNNHALQLVNELGNVSPVDPVKTIEERACVNHFESWLKSCINKPKTSKQPQYGNYTIQFLDFVKQTGFFVKFDDAEKMMQKCKELNRWVYHSVIHISRSKMKNVVELASFICPDLSRFAISSFSKFCTEYSRIADGDIDRLFCLQFIVNYGFAEIVKYMYDLNHSADTIYKNARQKDTSRRLAFNFNTSIDSKIEKDVISRFFANESEKLCPVCRLSTLVENERPTFALGHIIAHARGGTNERNNLIPICHRCNLDCRAEHLSEYCRRLYNRDIQ